MNSETGKVLDSARLHELFGKMTPEQRAVERPKWREFEMGEVIMVKGIRFRVHDIGDQRLVLKFD